MQVLQQIMALLTKSEFSEACGFASNALAVYVKRGKVNQRKDGLFDDQDEKNKAFIEKRKGRVETVEETVQNIEKQERKQAKQKKIVIKDEETGEETEVDDSEIPSYTTSERLLKYLDTQKREKEIEKLNLEIEKKKGEVIPSELIKPVFLQHNQFILMEMKNADDEMLSFFSHKYEMTADDTAYIRAEWIKRRNAALTNAITSSVKNVTAIVNDFSDKRGKGERL